MYNSYWSNEFSSYSRNYILKYPKCCIFSKARQPYQTQAFSLKFLHHIQQASSGRVIAPFQRPQPGKKRTPIRDRNPCPQQDSNPKSHTASCRRPTPWAAQSLGFAKYCITPLNCSLEGQGHGLCVEKRQNVFNKSSQVFVNGACLAG